MSNLAKRNGDARVLEVKRQYAQLANTLTKLVRASEDAKERKKELEDTIRRKCEREYAEKAEIAKQMKVNEQQLSETVGAVKLAMALLKKYGVDVSSAKLESLAERHEDVKELVSTN